jgi:hypothetical protein
MKLRKEQILRTQAVVIANLSFSKERKSSGFTPRLNTDMNAFFYTTKPNNYDTSCRYN